MDTSTPLDLSLRKATVERRKRPGHRCLGRQRDNHFALLIGVPTACFSAAQLRSLAEIVERYARFSHLTTAQSVLLVGIAPQHYEPARQAVRQAGFQIRSVGRDLFHVKCCPGGDFSPFGLQRTFDLVALIEEYFRGLPTPQKIKIALSGCPNCCANSRLSDFGLHAVVNGWKLYIGGRMGYAPLIGQELAGPISSDAVPGYLAAVLRVYRELAEPNERLFRTLERIGLDDFRQRVEGLRNEPYDDLVEEAARSRKALEEGFTLADQDKQTLSSVGSEEKVFQPGKKNLCGNGRDEEPRQLGKNDQSLLAEQPLKAPGGQ